MFAANKSHQDDATHRRALEMRNRAHDLACQAEREYDEGQRRHMVDLAETYKRAADRIDPPGEIALATANLVAHLKIRQPS